MERHMTKHVDSVGGGQVGLPVSYSLSQQDRQNLVLLRHILIEHAQTPNRQKRGRGGVEHISQHEPMLSGSQAGEIIVDLDQALHRLAREDARKSDIVQLLFFGGFTCEETAEALGISPSTVRRELRFARVWLYRELAQPDGDPKKQPWCEAGMRLWRPA
jgi:RNA polymerase sigma factor (sigma-70 family)